MGCYNGDVAPLAMHSSDDDETREAAAISVPIVDDLACGGRRPFDQGARSTSVRSVGARTARTRPVATLGGAPGDRRARVLPVSGARPSTELEPCRHNVARFSPIAPPVMRSAAGEDHDSPCASLASDVDAARSAPVRAGDPRKNRTPPLSGGSTSTNRRLLCTRRKVSPLGAERRADGKLAAALIYSRQHRRRSCEARRRNAVQLAERARPFTPIAAPARRPHATHGQRAAATRGSPRSREALPLRRSAARPASEPRRTARSQTASARFRRARRQ